MLHTCDQRFDVTRNLENFWRPKVTVKIRPKVKIADLKPQKRTSAHMIPDTLSPGPLATRVYQPIYNPLGAQQNPSSTGPEKHRKPRPTDANQRILCSIGLRRRRPAPQVGPSSNPSRFCVTCECDSCYCLRDLIRSLRRTVWLVPKSLPRSIF